MMAFFRFRQSSLPRRFSKRLSLLLWVASGGIKPLNRVTLKIGFRSTREILIGYPPTSQKLNPRISQSSVTIMITWHGLLRPFDLSIVEVESSATICHTLTIMSCFHGRSPSVVNVYVSYRSSSLSQCPIMTPHETALVTKTLTSNYSIDATHLAPYFNVVQISALVGEKRVLWKPNSNLWSRYHSDDRPRDSIRDPLLTSTIFLLSRR